MKVRQIGMPSQLRSMRYVPGSNEDGAKVNPTSCGSLASENFFAEPATRNLLAVSNACMEIAPLESLPFFTQTANSPTSGPRCENSETSGGNPAETRFRSSFVVPAETNSGIGDSNGVSSPALASSSRVLVFEGTSLGSSEIVVAE